MKRCHFALVIFSILTFAFFWLGASCGDDDDSGKDGGDDVTLLDDDSGSDDDDDYQSDDDDTSDDDNDDPALYNLKDCTEDRAPCVWIKLLETDATECLHGIWGFASDDIYAVGGESTDLSQTGSPFVLHYNGISWEEIETGFDQTLYDVWGASPTDLYVSGGPFLGEILHFDGKDWKRVYQDDRAYAFYKIWGADANDVYAISGVKMLYYNGLSWNRVEHFPEEVADDRIGTIWGYSESEVFASIGTASTEGPDYGHIIRFDGQGWSPMSDKLDQLCVAFSSSMWGDANGHVYYVQPRYIYRYDGESWHPWYFMLVNFMSIWGTAEDDIYVGGDVGTIAHYNGEDWCRMPGIKNKWWTRDIWGEPGGDLYAVATKLGDNGGVLLQCVKN